MNEVNIEWRLKFKQYTGYILIVSLSVISLVVFPMLGSNVNIDNVFPKNTIDWIIYIATRVLITITNMLIFTNFIQQAKLNVQDNENYIKAREILQQNKVDNYKPKSPAEYLSKTYLVKGGSLILGSITSLFTIGSALLTYDIMILFATIFTVIMSVICGVMTMQKTELYYTYEYLDYAKMIEKELKDDNNKWCNFKKSGRTGT